LNSTNASVSSTPIKEDRLFKPKKTKSVAEEREESVTSTSKAMDVIMQDQSKHLPAPEDENIDVEPLFTETRKLILQDQMRKHIQLTTQSYVLTASYPDDPLLKHIADNSQQHIVRKVLSILFFPDRKMLVSKSNSFLLKFMLQLVTERTDVFFQIVEFHSLQLRARLSNCE